MSTPYTIRTPRLGLRNWRDTDFAHYAAMNQDADVMRYFPELMTDEQTRASIERIRLHFEQNGFTFFATDLLEEDAFIGFIGLVNTRFEAHFTPCVEIGWRLRKEYWGRGLATEGASACLNYAFDTMEKEEIYSFTPVLNTPSERVMQKIGMKRIGTFDHPLVADHPLEEHVLYRSDLAEWKANLTIS